MTRKDQYFLAIVPPAPFATELTSLKEHFRMQYKTKAALQSPPHITLHMPFEWRDDREDYLVSMIDTFARSEQEFEVELHNFGCFEPRVIFVNVVENPSLNNLELNLHRFCKIQLGVFNARYQDRPYHPHLTLAFRDLKKEMFLKAWEEFSAKEFHAMFAVNSIVLLKHNGKDWEILQESLFRSHFSQKEPFAT